MKKEFNHEKIKEAIRTILTELGDDPDREGLKDTPDRVARMCSEIYGGLGQLSLIHISEPTRH